MRRCPPPQHTCGSALTTQQGSHPLAPPLLTVQGSLPPEAVGLTLCPRGAMLQLDRAAVGLVGLHACLLPEFLGDTLQGKPQLLTGMLMTDIHI